VKEFSNTKALENVNGLVFDIQRASTEDGPGIRTTVFLKGCQLRCAWCHNPESFSPKPQVLYHQRKCTFCGRCAKVCGRHKVTGEAHIFERVNCQGCMRCVETCLSDALEVCGKYMTVCEVLDEVKKDSIFYDTSGGGVTCSGGECMLQIDFLEEFLRNCKELELHTAVDTAGYVPWEYFERVMPHTDLFLYDIKALNGNLHKKYTGADNKLILSNFEKLIKICPEKVLARVPVIEEANGCEIDGITAYLAERGIKAELLPYNAMGKSKAAALGYPLTGSVLYAESRF